MLLLPPQLKVQAAALHARRFCLGSIQKSRVLAPPAAAACRIGQHAVKNKRSMPAIGIIKVSLCPRTRSCSETERIEGLRIMQSAAAARGAARECRAKVVAARTALVKRFEPPSSNACGAAAVDARCGRNCDRQEARGKAHDASQAWRRMRR